MSNVPRPTFTDIGVSLPAESEIQAGFWADFQEAFGGDLNESEATPQGQLVAALTAIQGGNNDLFAQFVNQVDPAYASGRMQDAIARIYFLTRLPSRSTVAVCTCVGAAGTVIPAGALAQATDGTIYESLGTATIPVGGSIDINFAAIDVGPIECPAGSLNAIYRVVPGWDTITNAADGVPGRLSESRAEFETRRAASVAGNATGILPAIRGAVLSVDGVVDAYVTENPTGSPTTIGGVSIAARSLYVAAFGGADIDVATAIWSRKPPGCGYVGNTTVAVEDKSEGYTPPYPTYSVTFQRPTALPIYIDVQLADNGQVPSDALDQVRAAVASAFNDPDSAARARIGAAVYAMRFVAGISALGSWVQVVDITVGTSASPTGSVVAVNINRMPTLDETHVTLQLV